jgi:hypothetical protein
LGGATGGNALTVMVFTKAELIPGIGFHIMRRFVSMLLLSKWNIVLFDLHPQIHTRAAK